MKPILFAFAFLAGCADPNNLKNMSAREINESLNAPLYEPGSVDDVWERAFYDESLSYAVRNKISDITSEYDEGKISKAEALRRIRAVKKEAL